MVFYADGLRFMCRQCSSCCRHESGFVFLSEEDVRVLATKLDIGYTAFVETYCRWVPAPGGTEQISLREKSNFDCIFWDGNCTVYDARPLQCRSFPFWESMVDEDVWSSTDCPGINHGPLHCREEIEDWLVRRRTEKILCRNSPGSA